MTLMLIVYVTDMAASTAFYAVLGGEVGRSSRSDSWNELKLGGAVLALHAAERLPDNRACGLELAFNSTEPLETLADRLRMSGVPLYRDITDEAFGRSLIIQDPDGLLIQINEHDADLYT